ncbi:MAG: DUF4296 domain-containing protein [Eudoraea sp.]|nr:DUF4296 domain-containing protein [Eudoraea sp.]
MLRKYIFLLFLVLVSCGEKVIEAPEDLIPKEKMVDILYDLSMINAAKATNPKILEQNDIEPTKFLFDKHRVDSLQFVQSDIYYASIPAEYQSIYTAVADRLEKDKKDIEEERKRKNDSTRQLSQKNAKGKAEKTVR